MDFLATLQQSVSSGNVPQLVQHMMSHALNIGTSDIHIEPEKKITQVRFRVDGMLRNIIQIPSTLHPALISRIKIMGGLKIDEQRIPQDGKTNVVTDDGKSMDLRINTLPTIYGEKIVIRLQDKSKTIPSFDQLGIRGTSEMHLNNGISQPNGIVLVTGPTGSGKTTTLYSALNKIKDEAVNIMTLEDPVEYEMQGLAQSQVKPDIGYGFAEGLRAALRQDPDIIMIGEIRDSETIEIAVKAALTGHLVLSTIHTNSAIATVSRILDMGVKPYLLGAALSTIQAQRLVRRVCSKCKEYYQPEQKLLDDILPLVSSLPKEEGVDPKSFQDVYLVRGKGCEACNHTGYHGRLGIYEVLNIDKVMERAIIEGVGINEMEDIAKGQGFVTMLQDGLVKALGGLTTVEEVFEVANKD